MGAVPVDLEPIETSLLCDAALAERFIELRAEIDRQEAVAARLLAAVQGRGIPLADGASSTAAWAQWKAGQRWQDAKASLDAGLVCDQLPLTAKAWAQGEISASAAKSICRGMRAGHEDIYPGLEEALVGFAASRNYRELDNLIGHYRKCCDAIDDIEPEDQNGLHLSPYGARWALNADLDALTGELLHKAIMAAIDAPMDGDTRNNARLRADALREIADFYLAHKDLPLEGGEAPHVTLVITWDQIMSWLPIKALPADPSDLAALLSTSQKQRLLCDANIAR